MHNKRHSIKSAFWHIFYLLFSKTKPEDISNFFTIEDEYKSYITLENALRIGNIFYLRILLNKDTPILNKSVVFRFDGRLPEFLNTYGISGAYDSENDYDIVKSALLSYSGYLCAISTSAKVTGSIRVTFISVFV